MVESTPGYLESCFFLIFEIHYVRHSLHEPSSKDVFAVRTDFFLKSDFFDPSHPFVGSVTPHTPSSNMLILPHKLELIDFSSLHYLDVNCTSDEEIRIFP